MPRATRAQPAGAADRCRSKQQQRPQGSSSSQEVIVQASGSRGRRLQIAVKPARRPVGDGLGTSSHVLHQKPDGCCVITSVSENLWSMAVQSSPVDRTSAAQGAAGARESLPASGTRKSGAEAAGSHRDPQAALIHEAPQQLTNRRTLQKPGQQRPSQHVITAHEADRDQLVPRNRTPDLPWRGRCRARDAGKNGETPATGRARPPLGIGLEPRRWSGPGARTRGPGPYGTSPRIKSLGMVGNTNPDRSGDIERNRISVKPLPSDQGPGMSATAWSHRVSAWPG